MRAHLSVLLVCLTVATSSGCRLAKDLLPRTHTTAVSPDGQTRAFVRQHLNSDPPDDHLYITLPGERAREVMALAPDADWCRAIVWSPDSRKVGFLINDQQLALYDARTFDPEAMLILASERSQEARSVRLERDGTVSFDVVERAVMDIPQKGGRRLEVRAVSIAEYRPGSRVVTPVRTIERRTVTIPTQRLSLLVRSRADEPAGKTGWARVRSRAGHLVQVPWTTADEGRVRLPAFNVGPLSVVEISVSGYRGWRSIEDVQVTGSPVAVTLPVE